jgi:hypothetical protein
VKLIRLLLASILSATALSACALPQHPAANHGALLSPLACTKAMTDPDGGCASKSPVGAPVPRAIPMDDAPMRVCSQDMGECPDGSWVPRSAPHCQFVCPAQKPKK